MKTPSTIAPPPARRHRPLPVEPFVFAALLVTLTLGINVRLNQADAGSTADTAAGATLKTQTAQPAQSVQVAHTLQER